MSRLALRYLLFPLAIGACASDVGDHSVPVDPPTDTVARQIDDYIRSLPVLPAAPAGIDGGDPTPAQREGDYQCVSQNLKETRQFDRIVAYAANSDSMWPGAIIAGD